MIPMIRVTLLLFLCCNRLLAADLSRATVVIPPGLAGPGYKAVMMLLDSVQERSRLRWPVATTGIPQQGQPVVVIRRQPPGSTLKPEGYRLHSFDNHGAAGVEITAIDDRGVLFGVGGLLRALEMRRDSVILPHRPERRNVPQISGPRPSTRLPPQDEFLRRLERASMWERYSSATWPSSAPMPIELIPPRSDDAADSPHFPLPPMQMMVEMSRLAKDYGLQCWIWYPAMDKDYSDPATVDLALKEWGEVFRQLPRIDAVFVPGGDPGHTHPKLLMALLEKQAANLKKYHPKAGMWVSPQSFNAPWMEEFFDLVNQQPAWLTGVVFGPQVRINLPELRQRIPKRYPIRFYPDITHSINAEFSVNDWDVAYAMTEEREVINPRPQDEAHIFRGLQPYADGGFITYSEGCNDDVNKFLWSLLGWNPEVDIAEALRDYGRYFIGPDVADAFAQGLLSLERNWRGPLLTNSGVDVTLAQFQEMERKATPQQKLNWRFQEALYRAHYDAYLRSRLLDESERERRAMERLKTAGAIGSLPAMEAAEKDLAVDPLRRAGQDLRARVLELAEALFQSIHMQLSVPRYAAISPGRGANLDLIDRPITDAPWLQMSFVADPGAGQRSRPPQIHRADSLLDQSRPWRVL